MTCGFWEYLLFKILHLMSLCCQDRIKNEQVVQACTIRWACLFLLMSYWEKIPLMPPTTSPSAWVTTWRGPFPGSAKNWAPSVGLLSSVNGKILDQVPNQDCVFVVPLLDDLHDNIHPVLYSTQEICPYLFPCLSWSKRGRRHRELCRSSHDQASVVSTNFKKAEKSNSLLIAQSRDMVKELAAFFLSQFEITVRIVLL